MQMYRAAFEARVVQRLLGPRAVSANQLTATVGVSQETLSRWLRHARSVAGMTPPKQRTPTWSGAEKLRVVFAAEGLDDAALGALLRHEGLHGAQLTEWRAAAEAALGASPARRSSGPSPEAQRIVALERELRRKEAALAETAALLVLKKKVQAIWEDGDDTTPPRRAR